MINVGSIVAGLDLDTGSFFTKFKQAQQETDNWGNKIRGMGGAVTDLGKTMTLGLTAPIVGVTGAIGKISMDFESGMSRVQAISGASSQDMALLADKAKEMGATTKFSASQSAEALTYMSMAGWDTSQMLAGLDGVMNLAAASGEDLGLVSDIVTDALSAFGMKAEQSGQFADLLANTSSNANTNVAMLGESFKYVAPVAGALGYSAEDTALALGLMANAGIKSSQAGTSLRGALTRLASPTKDMEQTLGELGISLKDNDGNMKSLDNVIGDLRGAFKGLDEDQQAQVATLLFGKEAMSGMLAVINASDEDYAKLSKATRDYNGAAKEMAEIMEDNAQGRITKLKSALEGVALQLGESLLPIAEQVVGGLQRLVDWFSKLDDGTKETIVKTGLLVAAIGPVLLIGGKLATGIMSIISLGSKVIGGIKAITGGIGLVSKAIGLISGGVGGFSGLLAALPAVINPVTVGIAGVGFAGYKLYKHLSEEATPAVKEFGESLSDATAESANAMQGLAQETGIVLDELAAKSTTITEEAKNNVLTQYSEMTKGVLTELENKKNEELRILQEGFAENQVLSEAEQEEILRAVEERYAEQSNTVFIGQNNIKQILETAMQEQRELTEEEVETINEIKNGALEAGLQAIAENSEEEKALLQQLHENKEALEIERIQEILKRSIQEKEDKTKIAKENYESQKKYAEQIKKSGVENADEKAKLVLEAAKTERDEAIRLAKEQHGEVTNELKKQSGEQIHTIDWTTGESLTKWQSFKKKHLELSEEQKEATTLTWDEIKTGVTGVARDIKRDASREWNELGINISNAERSINEGLDRAWEWAKTTVSTKATQLKDGAIKSFRALNRGISDNIRNIPSTLSNMMSNAYQSVADWFESFRTAGSNIVQNIYNGIVSKFNSVIDVIADMAQDIRDFFPFSPAKRGALRDLHKIKFGETIASAIYDGSNHIDEAFNNVLAIPDIEASANVQTITQREDINETPRGQFNFREVQGAIINALNSANERELVINIDGKEVARILAPLIGDENDRIKDYAFTGRGGEIW